MEREELVRLLRAFESSGLQYVLIGATAMGLHDVIRATEDVDIMVAASSANLDRLRAALKAAYPGDVAIDEIRDSELLGDYPSVRYYPPTGGLYLDAMTRLGTAADFGTIESQIMEVDGVRVPVATPAALWRLKKDTVRPLDRQDAAALAQRFGLRERG